MTFLVFDIETRVDKALIRATAYAHESVTEEDAYRRMQAELSESAANRGGFFPVSYHVPISIVLGRVGADHVLEQVDTLRAEESGESGIVRAFWEELEGFNGTLVSFNGRGFDLPVLELQALRFGCVAPKYFSQRDGFRARYGRHLDLYDFLTNSGVSRLRGGFDLLAKLVGLPGKSGVTGGDVQALWEGGRLEEIHRYCRRDVLQTYFLFLHVERLRGRLTAERFSAIEEATRRFRGEIEASSRG